MPNELFNYVLAAVGPSVALYVAIRVDLAIAKQKADMAHESAKDAHVRLYDHVDFHMKGAGHA